MTKPSQLIIPLLLLLVIISSQTIKKTAQTIELIDIQQKSGQTKIYNFTDIDDTKAIMIIYDLNSEKHDVKQKMIVEIKNQKQNENVIKCTLDQKGSICVLEKPGKEIKVSVECLSPQCTNDLIVSQRKLLEVQGTISSTIMGNIYKLQKNQFHSIIQIHSDRHIYRNLSNNISIFTNNQYIDLKHVQNLQPSTLIIGLTDIKQNSEQYIFVSNMKSNFNNFGDLKMSISVHSDKITVGEKYVDFFEPLKKDSQYSYTVSQIKNHLEVNCRLFAPKSLLASNQKMTFAPMIKTLGPNPTNVSISPNIDFSGTNKYYDFSFTIPKNSLQTATQLTLSFSTNISEIILFELQISDSSEVQISIFDDIYFVSQPGQTIQYKVDPQFDNTDIEIQDKSVKLKLMDGGGNFQIDKKECSIKVGCDLKVTVGKNKCEMCEFNFDLDTESLKHHRLYFEVKNNQVSGKIDIEQQVFFQYTLPAKTSKQILLNSINLLLYINFQDYEKCPLPTPLCHQYIINKDNPMILQNKEDKPRKLLIRVQGLTKTNFIIRFLDMNQRASIKLGDKFIYLMDDEEADVKFDFKLDLKDFRSQKLEHVSFNLLAPPHAVNLEVQNRDGIEHTSVEGYINFKQSEIKQDAFIITVKKMPHFIDEFVHFTLIVSTQDSGIKLDNGVTHYELFLPKTQKTFLIEYVTQSTTALNIYTQNLQKMGSKFDLRIKNIQQKDSKTFKKVINKDTFFVDLDDELSQLQICTDYNCELEVKITSYSNEPMEQALTFMAAESLIRLEDSIWQAYEVNPITKTSHFYFTPTHKNKSISLIFKTEDPHLTLTHKIFNNRYIINPQDWPFLHTQKTDIYALKNSQQITIQKDNKQLMKCWPTCVILININEVYSKGEVKEDIDQKDKERKFKSYQILASNNAIDFPEDTKLDISLKENEVKDFFISLSNFQNVQKFSFFTYFTIGKAKITAKIVHKTKEYNLGEDSKELIFNPLETNINTYQIVQVASDNSFLRQQSILKIEVKAEQTLKMTIQFTTNLDNVYDLKFGSLEVTQLKEKQEEWYSFVPQRDFELKFYRINGFPFIKIIKCQRQNYMACLNSHKQIVKAQTQKKQKQKQKEKEKGKDTQQEKILQVNLKDDNQDTKQESISINTGESQLQDFDHNHQTQFYTMIQKSTSYANEQCSKCIFFVWIYSFQEDLQLSINLRSTNTETELKVNNMLEDSLETGKHNKYLINTIPHKKTNINVRVLEGDIRVEISDSYKEIKVVELNANGNDYKDIEINPVTDLDLTQSSPQSQQIFRHIHATIFALGDSSCEYMISYSNGDNQLYLEDGVVVQKRINPSYPYTFLYRTNEKFSHAYLTVSSELLSEYKTVNDPINEYSIKFFYHTSSSQKEQFHPQKPPARNQNYLGDVKTIVYQLPKFYQLYQIQIQSKSFVKLTVSINHKQLIYLPINYEYLIKLHSKQAVELVIDTPKSQFLGFQIKKCDVSSPIVYYTNQVKDFTRGKYGSQSEVESSHYKQYIKTNENSKTMHIRLEADPDADSVMTIFVHEASPENMVSEITTKPGNHGTIIHELIDTDTATVTFKPVLCSNKPCTMQINYFYILSETEEGMVHEVNCPGKFFINNNNQNVQSAEVASISAKDFNSLTNQFKFNVDIKNSINFFNIRAVIEGNNREVVVYNAVEMSTFWGQLKHVSSKLIVFVVLLFAVGIVVLLAINTRMARSGYKPLGEDLGEED